MIKNVLIVIPAWNEERAITPVVESCRAFGDVLVVDDGSSDKTRGVAEVAGAVVISNITNKGYEYSLNVGYVYAVEQQYDAMITMDADGQLPPERIPDFISALVNGARLVVGTRKNLSRLCEGVLSFCSEHLSVIKDPYCGMKAYDLNIRPYSYFSRYNSIGTSLAFDYVDLDVNVTNIEIDMKAREGKSRFGGALISEFRLSLSMFVGLYRLIKIWTKKKLRKNDGPV